MIIRTLRSNRASLCEFDGESIETETREFPNTAKVIVEQILASKKKKSKREAARITVWDLSRKANHLSKAI